MGKVDEYFDHTRLQDFLAGKRDTPFSADDIQYAKWMGIDLKAEEKWKT